MNRKEDANFFWCDAYVIFFFCMIIQTNSSSLPFDIFYFHVPIKFNRHFDCQDVLVLGMTLFLVCYSSAFITGVQNIKWVFQLFLISVYIVMYYFCSFLFWKRLWLKLSSLFNSCNVLIVINWPSQRKKKNNIICVSSSAMQRSSSVRHWCICGRTGFPQMDFDQNHFYCCNMFSPSAFAVMLYRSLLWKDTKPSCGLSDFCHTNTPLPHTFNKLKLPVP